MSLSFSYIKQLQEKSQPVDQTREYQCQSCYRPKLQAKFVAIYSRQEAYCTVCVNEAK